MLPKWVKVTKIRIVEMQSTVTETKKNKLKTSVDGKEFILDNAESLLKDISNGKIDGSKFRERHINIIYDVEIMLKLKVPKNRKKNSRNFITVKIDDKRDGDETDDKQLDITDMIDLESKESAEQRRKQKGEGLKILTLNQMLSRLPTTFGQLKAVKNSENLKNEII